ncbi:hypothetical protein XELAEV_18037326mg [Xenopus laevis]|uniref:Uncharacterized protein n=1 Tax=Xenopus laevis TaxID=8355 RepID=A0A974CCK3_XENLA|nr:hypothetical protein XELAEV_18037326mg [Xenopus laevis]
MEDFLRSIQLAVDQHGLQWVKERLGNLPERSQVPAESKEMEQRVTRRRACPPERLSPSQESHAVRRRRSRSPGIPVAKRALVEDSGESDGLLRRRRTRRVMSGKTGEHGGEAAVSYADRRSSRVDRSSSRGRGKGRGQVRGEEKHAEGNRETFKKAMEMAGRVEKNYARKENCDRMYNNDMLDLRIAGMIAAARNAVSTSGVEVPIVTKEQNLRNAENKGNEGDSGTNQKSAVAVEPAISKGKEPEKENTKSKESEVGRSLPISDNARSQTYICFEGPLGVHLSVEIREKIMKNEYVDIFTLLPLERFNLDKWEKGKKARKQEDEDRRRFRLIPHTFSNWLQAFAILASIIGERKPEKCSALFCYMNMKLEAFRVYLWRDSMAQIR